ncbi:Atu4866 domain-containing protein [Paenibacillus sp. TRM 82003]|uniref:Atu4866 domain-containing protein n=1 Tax=Kineococcus sp. TRM81007 TaxID=2925831 RepID=UPI001F5977D0|nr:Atu4866 domain-containing protein [Kineococcus sp. TRM81007]MCI2237013.1 Atu4866 domain-containing protein [Kineococcus sp. TRM81007]MCI3926591.1 Atu4866 domain-containing protein [Paenibacillus sp. TRM 82003]
MPNTFPAFTAAGLAAVRAGADRPLLLTNATVHTLDPLIGTVRGADVLVGGALIVGVGPGIVTAAEDDGAVVIDATGTTVLPARLDATATLDAAARGAGPGTLAPGADASLVVVPDAHAPDLATALHTSFTRPELLLAVLREGRPVRWAGDPLGPAPARTRLQPDRLAVDPSRVGVWVDTDDFLHQELTADGRYDETRGGRPHAFTGRYWIDGDRVDYLDDLGFWAFGRFADDALHHAGYTMHREDAR